MGDRRNEVNGWAHKKDSGNLEPTKFLSYRGGWAQASEPEKKESIRIRRLGTAASLSEKGLKNHYRFCGSFFLKSTEVPNRDYKPQNPWIPKS